MSKIILTRGIPASGKTTWAKQWVQEDPENRVRANRDELRNVIQPGNTGVLTRELEELVTQLQQSVVTAALNAGKGVVLDDTNLRARYAKEWFKFGEVEFKDFPIDVDEAIRRDAERERPVGEGVIRSFYEKFTKKGVLNPAPERPVVEPQSQKYERDTSKPMAIIVDTDGTVAKMNGRGPYDQDVDSYMTDLPVEDVIRVVNKLSESILVIGVTGRSGEFLDVTKRWWQKHRVRFDEFYSRAEGDKRRDDIVKREIFFDKIADRYNVVGAFDDRLRVSRMWHQIGVTLFRVGDPDADF